MISEFSDALQKNAHSLFQNWRLKNPKGFFLTSKSRTSYFLHHVGCNHIGDPFWSDKSISLTSKLKICSLSSKELLTWLNKREFSNKICKDCIDSQDPRHLNPTDSSKQAVQGWIKPHDQAVKPIKKSSENCSYWVIKGNPRMNNWGDMLAPGSQSTWRTARPPKNWKKGDRIFCWESTPSLCMIGFAEIANLNKGRDEYDDYLFDVRYLSTPLDYKPSLSELRSIEDLSQCTFLKVGPATTVFPITYDQASIIYQLIFQKSHIKQNIWPDLLAGPIVEVPDVDDLTVAKEGKKRLVQHFLKERNTAIIKKKKAQVLKKFGKIACDVCGFDFGKTYGELGHNFCEVHHLIPLSESVGSRETNLSDLIVICSNCHRMIHRLPSKDSLKKLKVLVNKNCKEAL